MATEAASRGGARAPATPGTDRRGDQREDAKDDCGEGDAAACSTSCTSAYMRVSKKFYAHDEQGEARQGDTVRIVETRPLSKLKRWRLAEVLSRSTSVD